MGYFVNYFNAIADEFVLEKKFLNVQHLFALRRLANHGKSDTHKEFNAQDL